MAETAARAGLRPQLIAGALILMAGVSVQLGGAFAKTLFPTLGPVKTVFVRILVAAALLLVVYRPHPRRYRREDLLTVVAFGLVTVAMNTAFYFAIQRIPLGVAVTLEFFGPLSISLLASRRAIDFLWVLLAAAGVAALTTGGAHLDPVGMAFSLIAACLWAAYILLSQRTGRAIKGGAGLAMAMGVGAVGLAPFGLANPSGFFLHSAALPLAIAVGVLSSAIPYRMEMEALRYTTAGVFGVLLSVEPALAAGAGYLVLGETMELRRIAGVVLVGVASAGAAYMASRRPLAALADVPPLGG